MYNHLMGKNNIAYGGGMDSTSLVTLILEYPLITQLDKDDDRKKWLNYCQNSQMIVN